jgi:predicted transcriptional regulator
MGRHPTGKRKYNIEHLWDQHHEIMRLAVMGMKSVDIAAQLGVSEVMVSYTLNSPLAMRQLDLLRATRDAGAVDVAKRIKELAALAVEKLEPILEDGSESNKLKAIFGLLDRAGHAPVQRFQGSMAVLTKDDIMEIRDRARMIGALAEAPLIEA